MINGMKCPKCGADCSTGVTSLDGWNDDLSNGFVFVDLTCTNCKTEFTNVYRLDHQELTYDEESPCSVIVTAEVDLQVWVHDYAFTLDTVKFNCEKCLDEWEIEEIEGLDGKPCEETDEIYYTGVRLGLVKPHDGPFSCYINEEELAAYIKARKELA